MPLTNQTPQPHRGDRGVAMVEFSFVLPLLALFLFGVMDIGSMLNEYLVLTQVAHETARLGANTPFLEPGASCALSADINAATLPSSMTCPTPMATHSTMLNRAQLLARYSALNSLYEFRYTVEFQPAAAATTTTTLPGTPTPGPADMVSLHIEAKYRAVFPLFDGAPLAVRATAPYMY